MIINDRFILLEKCSRHIKYFGQNLFTPAEGFSLFSASQRKIAFTLAEVLITLGIIGVVAAMTLPTLIQKHNNQVVATRLHKFYSVINQAVTMAEVDYGNKEYWYEDLAGASIDKDGKPVAGTSPQEKWFNKYLAPYMKISSTKLTNDGSLMIYLPDGSAFRLWNQASRDWFFYPGKPDKCMALARTIGVCGFVFSFVPNSDNSMWHYHYKKGVEPNKFRWDGNPESLYEGHPYSCASNGYRCTAFIQANGWTIPKNYPYKVRY